MNRLTFVAILLLAATVSASPASAQSVYRYVYPDGRTVYSDKPVPGAKLEEELDPPPPPDLENAARQKQDNEASGKDFGRAADRRALSLDQAWADLKLWTRKLEEARAELAAGRETREGERTGTAGGKARMNDGYWQRQKDNQAAVAEAEARVRKAQDAVNSLR